MSGEQTSRQVIAANLKALMQSRPDLNSAPKLAARTSLGGGTISRIKNGVTAASADTIDILAKAFDIEPWQLLVPSSDKAASELLRKAQEMVRRQFEAIEGKQ